VRNRAPPRQRRGARIDRGALLDDTNGGVSARRFPRTVAITGLGSFVGRSVAARLLDAPTPPDVIGIDLAVPRRLEGRVRFHRVDLTEPTADSVVAEILEKERCEAVLHAAFFTDPHPGREYAHELEVIGSLHVINASAAAGVGRLVLMSDARVYGARPDNPNFLTEDHPLRGHPKAHAVRDRVELEGLLDLFARRHPAMAVASLRPCWVFGPTHSSGVTRHFEGRRVRVPMGYDPLLQCLHEDDLLRAVETALAGQARGAFNLAGSEPLPVSTLLRVAGKRARAIPHPLLFRLEYLESMSRTGDPPEAFYDYLRYLWVVDTTQARESLDFEPHYTTKEAWMSFVVSRRLRRYR
jgi:UDP-glucose 4-epimerase